MGTESSLRSGWYPLAIECNNTASTGAIAYRTGADSGVCARRSHAGRIVAVLQPEQVEVLSEADQVAQHGKALGVAVTATGSLMVEPVWAGSPV